MEGVALQRSDKVDEVPKEGQRIGVGQESASDSRLEFDRHSSNL